MSSIDPQPICPNRLARPRTRTPQALHHRRRPANRERCRGAVRGSHRHLPAALAIPQYARGPAERTHGRVDRGGRNWLARPEALALKKAADGLAALVPEAAIGGQPERAHSETGQYIRRTCVFLGILIDLCLGHAEPALGGSYDPYR